MAQAAYNQHKLGACDNRSQPVLKTKCWRQSERMTGFVRSCPSPRFMTSLLRTLSWLALLYIGPDYAKALGQEVPIATLFGDAIEHQLQVL